MHALRVNACMVACSATWRRTGAVGVPAARHGGTWKMCRAAVMRCSGCARVDANDVTRRAVCAAGQRPYGRLSAMQSERQRCSYLNLDGDEKQEQLDQCVPEAAALYWRVHVRLIKRMHGTKDEASSNPLSTWHTLHHTRMVTSGADVFANACRAGIFVPTDQDLVLLCVTSAQH